MEAQESSQKPTQTDSSFTKSWTAYFTSFLIFLVMALVSAALFYMNQWLGIAFSLLSIGIFIYQFLMIHSYLLYTNEHGVWVYSGILPWSKGVIGVKWRDMEDAVYYSNFFSWMLKSYTVRISHRFTKTSEIILTHIKNGHDAVTHINQLHQQMLSSESTEK
ncbi:hypothetical protein [Sulfuricurvum sp.]|uniref:hypothetical protein n=1 Tax=Sulfuricurvum sp. TaxID=2025608 RepID=UPI003BB211BF